MLYRSVIDRETEQFFYGHREERKDENSPWAISLHSEYVLAKPFSNEEKKKYWNAITPSEQ